MSITRVVIGVASFTLVAFLAGRFFDSRCDNGCIANLFDSDTAFALGAKKYSIDLTKTVSPDDISKVKELSIKGISANVMVRPTTASALSAHLVGQLGLQLSPQQLSEFFEMSVSGASAAVRVENSSGNFHLGQRNLHLEILLPKTYQNAVVVKLVSGDVTLEDNQLAALTVRTVSGDIKTRRLKVKHLDFVTVSGSYEGENLQSETSSFASVSGDISVAGLLGNTQFHTTSGDVKLTLPELIGSVEGSSTSGDISLTVPQQVNAKLSATSRSGDISTSHLTMTQSINNEHMLKANLGNGTYALELSSTSGDIEINGQ